MADVEPREIEDGDSTQKTENSTEKDTENNGQSEKPNRLTKFPLSRVKHMMKLDPDVTLASQESVYLITKATEMFVDYISKYSHNYTSQSKRKTMQRKDIDSSIQSLDELAFLEGTLE
ncbi:DNA polymerase epsilon subunit 4-like [Saccoglossus kowalevskii]|uniref:DNA polymerase epsilon subunit 4-like n=1 Tax=Saccoglossus kowalevskii TaxID=10224 RepID=A0ABM0GLH6_SACKO|nr:PREDICTED: DNA polymerase epsilon subunit 4-like [Saccoglossus kowalevskii]